MKLERLVLKGITRFADTVEINFRDLPAGLVAIVGENGSGKSTILDSCLAAIYRKFPSRADKPLLDYATRKDSRIALSFNMAGTHYETVVSMDGLARKSDAVIAWDGPQTNKNDGKVSTFDEVVRSRFPEFSVVLASAFSAQNRNGSFLTLDRTGRKDLFAELLGLAHYDQMADRARQKVVDLARRRDVIQEVVGNLEATQTEEARTQLAALDTTTAANCFSAAIRRDEAVAAQPTVEATKAEAQGAYDAAREAARAYELALAEVNRLKRTTESLQEDLARVEANRAAAVARIRGRAHTDMLAKEASIAAVQTEHVLTTEFDREVQAIERAAQALTDDLDARIRKNQTELLDRADEIQAAVATVTKLDAEIDSLGKALEAADDIIREGQAARAKGADAPSRLKTATNVAAFLDKVPCKGAGEYATCALLKNAVEAKSSIDAIMADVRALKNIETVLDAASSDRAEIQTSLTVARNARAAAVPLAAKKADLDAAEDRIKERQAERQRVIDRMEVDRRQAAKGHTERVEAANQTRARLQGECDALVALALDDERAADREAAQAVKDILVKITTLNVDIGKLAVTIESQEGVEMDVEAAQAALAAADRAIGAHRQQLTEAERLLVIAEHERVNYARLRADFDDCAATIATYHDELAPLLTDLAEWDLLAQCFGREGLPVLEIDAAGPAISDLCNDLLRSCFGSARFTVELVTQQAKADKKGFKEVFELKVYDSERGGEARDIKDLSGGEQVIVDEALKSAIALYVGQHTGIRWETAFRDETTGALDPDNAIRYIALLRRLQERGGFHQVIFISHNPDAAALADVQLVVKDGTVTPRYAA